MAFVFGMDNPYTGAYGCLLPVFVIGNGGGGLASLKLWRRRAGDACAIRVSPDFRHLRRSTEAQASRRRQRLWPAAVSAGARGEPRGQKIPIAFKFC
jgi:hypothetical protein